MSDLIAEFLAEANEDLQLIDSKLIALESNPQKLGLVDDIFRVIHSIKGTCGFFELNNLALVSHASEDILSKIRNHEVEVNQKIISVIIEAVDVIKDIILYVQRNGKEQTKDYSKLIQKITDVTQSNKFNDFIETKNEVDTNIISSNSIRVSVDVMEDLMREATELVLNRNELFDIAQRSSNPKLTEALDKLDHITSKIQEAVIDSRLQPISNAWSQLPRIARDLANILNKKVKLIMRGESTRLDKQLIEAIKNPLVHMLRNSVDHGIETSAERIKLGKPEEGIITLTARNSSGCVIIDLTDDGKGIDVDEVRKKILEKKLLTKDNIDLLSDEEVIQYIFHPGFSTLNKATAISGRGVGMDVVKKNIQALHGDIKITSVQGKGMVVTIIIPLTLAIMPALFVGVAGMKFAIPEINVKEIVDIGIDSNVNMNIKYSKNQLKLRNTNIPCISLTKLLKLPDKNLNFVVICKIEDKIYGLVVDKIYSVEEIVLKPASKLLDLTSIYMGNALFGDNEIILLLNPTQIMKYCEFTSVSEDLNLKNIPKDLSKFLLFEIKNECKAIEIEKIVIVKEIGLEEIFSFKKKKFIKFQELNIPIIFLDNINNLLVNGCYKGLILKINNEIFAIIVNKVEGIVDAYKKNGAKSMLTLDKRKIEIINIEKIIERYNEQ